MPKLTRGLPSYRRHKSSGQAVVTLDGRDFYLGPHGAKVSRAEYDRVIGEWAAYGRRLRSGDGLSWLGVQVEFLGLFFRETPGRSEYCFGLESAPPFPPGERSWH